MRKGRGHVNLQEPAGWYSPPPGCSLALPGPHPHCPAGKAGRRPRWQAWPRPPARLTQLSLWRGPYVALLHSLEQLGASQAGPSCSCSAPRVPTHPRFWGFVSWGRRNADSRMSETARPRPGRTTAQQLTLQMRGTEARKGQRTCPRLQRTCQRRQAS